MLSSPVSVSGVIEVVVHFEGVWAFSGCAFGAGGGRSAGRGLGLRDRGRCRCRRGVGGGVSVSVPGLRSVWVVWS